MALSSVGFGAITTFIALFFAQQGWPAAWVALTSLSVAFIAGRMLFGHLPDRLGDRRHPVLAQTGHGALAALARQGPDDPWKPANAA